LCPRCMKEWKFFKKKCLMKLASHKKGTIFSLQNLVIGKERSIVKFAGSVSSSIVRKTTYHQLIANSCPAQQSVAAIPQWPLYKQAWLAKWFRHKLDKYLFIYFDESSGAGWTE
jgi:hypothetical protein